MTHARPRFTVSDIAAAQTSFNGIGIPGMNAIAFTREVRALARLEGWSQSTMLNNILRTL
jgi:hypothetical protein